MDDKGMNEKEENIRRPRGFLNPGKVKAFVFTTITLCIVLGVIVSILAIWDFAEKNALYRTLATLGVIAVGCAIFSMVNEKFGD